MDERELAHMVEHAAEHMNMDFVFAAAISAKITPQKLVQNLMNREAIENFAKGVAVAMASEAMKAVERELKKINKKK